MSHPPKQQTFTHRGTVIRSSLNWEWSEKLRETPKYWVSQCPSTKYRKTDGKRVGLVNGDDRLLLESIVESK